MPARATDDHRLGLTVQAARRRAGLTQEALAALIARTPESVSNIERGRQLPTIETLVDLVRVLEVPPPDFLDGLDGGSGLSRERVGHARLRAASPPAGGEHHVDAFAAPHPDAAQRPDLLAPAEGFLDPLADPLADGIARVARGPLVNGGVTAGQGDRVKQGGDKSVWG